MTKEEYIKTIAKILNLHRYKGHWEDSESYDMTDAIEALYQLHIEGVREAERGNKTIAICKHGVGIWNEYSCLNCRKELQREKLKK